MHLDVVIMAAGKGTRMKSARPKVLHPIAGKPMVLHVLHTAAQLRARSVTVVTGHQAQEVEEVIQAAASRIFAEHSVVAQLQFARQSPQLGTGHAVQQAAPLLPPGGVTLILSGDVPLIQAATLQTLLAACEGERLALLTIRFDQPQGYGRIVRNNAAETGNDNVLAIVEEKDATPQQKAIQEVYSGMMAVPTAMLQDWLSRLDNHNAQGEYYLTDIVKFAVEDGIEVTATCIDDALQVAGVNSPAQLSQLERAFQLRQAQQLMEQGVRIMDPHRIDIRGSLECGQDVEIDVNCVFIGKVVLGDGVTVRAFSQLEDTTVGAGSQIGPFARLRPGSVLAQDVHIGNFVEVKNSRLGQGAKANHLAYLGDATVGERVNYGAGSITANYDGANKHPTTIENDVHIGSNSVLVAPVTIGAGGTVGAGSVVTKSTAPQTLTVVRAKAVTIANYQRPEKKKSPE